MCMVLRDVYGDETLQERQCQNLFAKEKSDGQVKLIQIVTFLSVRFHSPKLIDA